MRIKVLYLIDKLVPAGTQTNLLEIVKRLDRNKFEPHVIALVEGGGLKDEFDAAGIRPIVLSVGKVYGPSGFKVLRFLIRYMREHDIDIVETHFLHADILGTLAAKWARVPRIVTARRDEGFWRGKRQLLLNKHLNRLAHRVLVNSLAVRESVRQSEDVSSGKIQVIHNGVDTRRYFQSEGLRRETRRELGFKDDEFVIGVVANMRHQVKGHRYAIKALSLVKKEMDNIKLILVGDGPLESYLERYAASRDVLDQVLFLGSRREVNAYLNAMDIVCVPSLSEGFSNSVLEAMSAGKPVIATNVGGNPEAVVHGETGFLVRPRDGKAIAEKVFFLIQNEQARTEMGNLARKLIEGQFTVENMVKEYETFYEELLSVTDEGRRVPVPSRVTRHLSPMTSHGSPVRRHRLHLTDTRSRRIQILHLIWSLDLGGAEQVVIELARKLKRRNFKSTVCCLNEKGRFAPKLEREGIRVVALRKKPKFDPFLLPKLVRLLTKERIDLIHTHLFSANLWGRIAAKLTGIPVISSEHGMDHWRTPFHLTLDWLLTPVSKRLVFVSEAVKRFYMERNPSLNGKASVIRNGIDISSFEKSSEVTVHRHREGGQRMDRTKRSLKIASGATHPRNDGVPERVRSERDQIRESLGLNQAHEVIGIVGRLVPEKSHADFIDSIQLLLKKRKDCVGFIVGEGPLSRDLRRQAQRAGLEKQIIFAGFRSDLPKLYQALDVLVLCSLHEGFPLVVIEAMAAGVPVVATGVGGVTELIQDEEDGLLVPVNDPFALSRAISRVLSDRTLRERLTHRAKEKVRHDFNVDRMVEDYESLYREVLTE